MNNYMHVLKKYVCAHFTVNYTHIAFRIFEFFGQHCIANFNSHFFCIILRKDFNN